MIFLRLLKFRFDYINIEGRSETVFLDIYNPLAELHEVIESTDVTLVCSSKTVLEGHLLFLRFL